MLADPNKNYLWYYFQNLIYRIRTFHKDIDSPYMINFRAQIQFSVILIQIWKIKGLALILIIDYHILFAC